MKTILQAAGILTLALFIQKADAQIALQSTTSAAANATLNATRATNVVINTTNRVTMATNRAVSATTGALVQSTNAAIKAGNRVENNTRVAAKTAVTVQNNNRGSVNSNAGGEERGIIRAQSSTDANLHAEGNAVLPVRESKEAMTSQTDAMAEKADRTKAATVNTTSETKAKASAAKPEVHASGEAKAQGSVKAGKQ